MKTLPTLVAILLAMTLFLACDKEKTDKNTVSILIEKPVENEKVENASQVDISVFFTAEEQIHKFIVQVTPVADPTKKLLDYEQLAHRNDLQYVHTMDLSAFPENTTFLLHVKACGDHDCQDTYEKSGTFRI